jgi:demethylmenaquinone methyltransferase/2-methoxy-6-polyprenyl-1,4-benzoquinol methylase
MKLDRQIGSRIEDPTEKRAYVRGLFAGIAGRYDFTNDVMSLGLHRRWKRKALRIAGLAPGQRVLDLAAGTGDLGRGALLGSPGVEVVAVDLTPEMLRVGSDRPGPAPIGWVTGDALELPFAPTTFDRVLIGYGLRNFADLDGSLAEILRCLRPGGRLVALDFGHPRSRALRKAYLGYLDVSTRAVGWVLHRDAESYVYIPESLRRYPGQMGVLRSMESAGYESCGIADLLGGAMAINFGDRPSA